MVETITDADFGKLIEESDLPVFIDFWAPRCGPCRMMAPILEEVSEEYKGRMRFFKMNVDENPVTPRGYGVNAIPTMVIIRGQDTVGQIIGAAPKEEIKRFIEYKGLHALPSNV